MSSRPQWAYVQARLQSRHGGRLDEAGWRALEAVQSVDQLIERVRVTPLRRFTERINSRMSSHAIERLLRDGWRDYVAEVAAWLPTRWRAATLWTSRLPELPLIDAVLKDAAPGWANDDAALSVTQSPTPLAPLMASPAQDRTLAARWYAHWRSLWPKQNAGAERALVDLAARARTHVERLNRAAPQDTSARYRGELVQAVTRIFRRHGGAPVAVFCHLVLVALDLERLRGALARRRLFAPEHAKEAA